MVRALRESFGTFKSPLSNTEPGTQDRNNQSRLTPGPQMDSLQLWFRFIPCSNTNLELREFLFRILGTTALILSGI